MKKSLKDLKENGWEISESDRERIANSKRNKVFDGHVSDISSAVGRLAATADEIKKSGKESTSRMEALIAMQTQIVDRIAKRLDVERKIPNWEFDVRRNKEGFISKVFARQA